MKLSGHLALVLGASAAALCACGGGLPGQLPDGGPGGGPDGGQCASGETSCGGACALLAADPGHCGSCERSCAATESCIQGRCQVFDCRQTPCPGGTYCSLNTGRCLPGCAANEQCPAGAVCDLAAHQCVCAATYHSCGGACVKESADSCGAQCIRCQAPSGGTVSCGGGQCQEGCPSGQHQCGASCASDTSTDSCGSSCSPCAPPANGIATCAHGSCGFTCAGNLSVCGGGCADFQSDAANCGSCGHSCGASAVCQLGKCLATCSGTPALGVTHPLALGFQPTLAALGRFTGHASVDLALVNGTSVSVYAGAGDGTFNPSPVATKPLTGVNYVDGLAGGDFDGDGVPDLVVAYSAGLSLLLGDGKGGFSDPTSPVWASGPYGILVADLNHDGVSDVVSFDDGRGGVTVNLGDGKGGLGSATSYSLNSFTVDNVPVSIAVGDFNGDHVPDLAVAVNHTGLFSNSTIVFVLLGNGDGTFQARRTVFTGRQHAGALAAGDFEGDGKAELAFLDDGTLRILHWTDSGSFTATAPLAGVTSAVVAADLNGDGKDDLIAFQGNGATLLLGGAQGLSQAGTYSLGTTPSPLAMGLIDSADLIPDLLIANGGVTQATAVLGTCR